MSKTSWLSKPKKTISNRLPYPPMMLTGRAKKNTGSINSSTTSQENSNNLNQLTGTTNNQRRKLTAESWLSRKSQLNKKSIKPHPWSGNSFYQRERSRSSGSSSTKRWRYWSSAGSKSKNYATFRNECSRVSYAWSLPGRLSFVTNTHVTLPCFDFRSHLSWRNFDPSPSLCYSQVR